MSLAESLLAELEREIDATRRLIERVPESDLLWRPHPRSMTLGQLATHLAEIPRWTRTLIEDASYDVGRDEVGADAEPRQHGASAAILGALDDNLARARRMLTDRSDAELLSYWTLRRDGHELFTVPRVAALRAYVLNHLVHHRGQLSVYLRLRDVALPPIHGPSADEPLAT
jgi:uncharacterized damage-inducible protein DinB